MNVSCPECRSVFRIDPAKVPEAGARARCNVCGAVMDVQRAGTVREAPRRTPMAVEAVEVEVPTPAAIPQHVESVASPAVAPPSAPAAAAEDPRPVGSGAPTPETLPVGEPAPASAEPARARPFNPYLNNTPELRARRLARALVSDLVAYNPQKREQGLRDGTLRQLFREEIRKSWDEYVEQVGASVAESTPHFQDALNDVLAGGQRVF